MYQIPHFCAVIFFSHIVIARKRSYGKVMFLHLSVILFIGCGLCPWGVFIHGGSLSEGFLSGESLSGRVSIREGSLSRVSLSGEGVSIRDGSLSERDLCTEGLCPGWSLSGGVSVTETPVQWKSWWYTSNGRSRISPRRGRQLPGGANIRFCQNFPKTA